MRGLENCLYQAAPSTTRRCRATLGDISLNEQEGTPGHRLDGLNPQGSARMQAPGSCQTRAGPQPLVLTTERRRGTSTGRPTVTRGADDALRERPPVTFPPGPRFLLGGAPEQVTRPLWASVSPSGTQWPHGAEAPRIVITGLAAPPGTGPASETSTQPRADAAKAQFPRLGQLASGRRREPAARRPPPGSGLTGRRGTISTEQQWQKYRPGCGDASAMAAAASSAPPAPRAAPAAGRLQLSGGPTSPRTLTHSTHSARGGVESTGAGLTARFAGGGSADGGRRGPN